MLQTTSLRGSVRPAVCPTVRPAVRPPVCLTITPFDLPSHRCVSKHLMPCIRPCFHFMILLSVRKTGLGCLNYSNSSTLTVLVSPLFQDIKRCTLESNSSNRRKGCGAIRSSVCLLTHSLASYCSLCLLTCLHHSFIRMLHSARCA